MQTFTRSVFDLFSSKKRYLVPMFQRPYVWSLERQWEPLWEDIRTKAQEILEGQDVDPHFMGAIVINQVRTYGPAIPAHEIIDGQQRLTTFQLFLAAFRDIAQEYGDDDVTRELNSYTLNFGRKASPEEEFKVWPTRADQKAFSQSLKSGSRGELEKLHPPVMLRHQLQPRHKMVEAYLFFESSIRLFIGGDPTAKIEALFSALQNSLQLVSIELETKDDPQVIFETLNARGEPLLSSDLLRNFIFLRAKQEDLSPDELYDLYWEWFDTVPAEDANPANGFWKKVERQGRLYRPRLDLFIQHFLSLKTGRDVNVTRLFHDYKQWVESERPFSGVEEELKELRRYAEVFAKFFVPDKGTALGRFVLRLRNLLDTNTVFPFLLYLEADSGLDVSARCEMLQALESYLVRRIVCGYTEKNYNRLFLQLIRTLKEAPAPSVELFRSTLLALQGESSCWPDDNKFADAWLSQPIYRTAKSSARVEHMLRAIEEHLVSDRREQIQIHGSLSIEHILPQEWEQHWPLLDDQFAPDSRETLIHTFGNLTLLTSKLNSAISNGPYANKRSEIVKQSALQLNAYFQDITVWDDIAIRSRGRHLFQFAEQIWPFPKGAAEQLPLEPNPVTTEAPISHMANDVQNGSRLALYANFWEDFVAFLQDSGSTLKPNKPYPQNWIYIPFGIVGFKLEATVVSAGSSRISCGLTIQRPDAAAVLEFMRERQLRIEEAFGSSLDWSSRNHRSEKERHVQAHLDNADVVTQVNWPDQFRWMASTLEALYRAFLPAIKQAVENSMELLPS